MTDFSEFGELIQEPIRIINKPKLERLIVEEQTRRYFTKGETKMTEPKIDFIIDSVLKQRSYLVPI